MIAVRLADNGDLPALVTFGIEFVTTYAVGPWDEQGIETLIDYVVKSGIALIAERDNLPAGMLLAVQSPCIFSCKPVPIWQEIAWWVAPEHRSGGVGVALLDAFEAAAGSDPAMLSTLPTTHVETAWLASRGWRGLQTSFARNM